MKKVKKGEYGYIHSQKIRRSVWTFLSLLIPVVIFIIGYVINGKRENMFFLPFRLEDRTRFGKTSFFETLEVKYD